MIQFVTSTMLLIGFSPIASSRYCSHSGDGCTVTFSNTSALYRGHRVEVFDLDPDAGAAGRQQFEHRPDRAAASAESPPLRAPCRDGPTDPAGA